MLLFSDDPVASLPPFVESPVILEKLVTGDYFIEGD